jgi:hypothetical protein
VVLTRPQQEDVHAIARAIRSAPGGHPPGRVDTAYVAGEEADRIIVQVDSGTGDARAYRLRVEAIEAGQ